MLGYRIGEGTTRFLKHLGWIGGCFLLSKIIGSAAPAVAARLLGGSSFGDASLVLQSAGQLMYLAILLNMHLSMIRYGTGEGANRGAVVGVGLLVCAVTGLVIAAAVHFVPDRIAAVLHVDGGIVWYGFRFVVVFAIYTLLTSLLQMLNDYRARGVIEVVFAVLLLPGLLLGGRIAPGSYESLILAFIVAYGVPSILLAAYVLKRVAPVSLRLSLNEMRHMLGYGLLGTIGSIGYVLTFAVQPLQINDMLSNHEVGVYRVYAMGSVGMAMFATSVFQVVFFPKAAASTDRLAIWNPMLRVWIRLAPLAFLGFAALASVMLLLAGRQEYGYDIGLLAIFSLAATLMAFQSAFGMLITSQGVRGAHSGLWLSVVTGAVNVFATQWLVPRIGLHGGAVALVLSYTVAIAGTMYLKRILRNDTPAVA